MTGKVSGFDTHTITTATGRLKRRQMAAAAARIICPGIGMNARNRPTEAA